MNRLIASTLLVGALGGSIARADFPTAEVAARAWAATDLVLTRSLEPPLRQPMILAAIKALAASSRVAAPRDLALRVSNLANPEQLAGLLAEVLAGPKAETKDDTPGPFNFAVPRESSPEEAFYEGLFSPLRVGARLIPEKERKVQESMQANLYVGIQVQLGFAGQGQEARPSFQKILEGGPADHAGAQAGDLIEEVDGMSTAGMPLAKVVDRLRGVEGTDVVLKLRRPSNGEILTKTMTRGRLPRATVEGSSRVSDRRWSVRLESSAPIGYLKLTEVSGSTPQELRGFAAQLEAEGAKALVLDLRNTSPAHFHETVLLADALLDGGVIGKVRSVDGEKTYIAEPDALFRDWPMVVLVAGNHDPEVAWLCAALEDNHRATILGAVVFPGDATVSEMIALPGGDWSLELETGRLERGDGGPIGRPTSPVARDGKRTILERTRDVLDRAKQAVEQYPIPPTNPNATAAPRRAVLPVQPARAQDLARAIEILETALKAAAK